MSASTVLFLLIRSAHVLLAATWVGAVAFTTFYVMPALEDAGPSAGPVMGALARRKVPVFMAVVGGTTVLTGFYLYHRFTSGFDPALAGSMGARVFGMGGLAGVIALILGGAVVGRNVKKMAELGARLASAPDTERAALASQIATARQRVSTFSRIIFALQAIAVVLMAIGHYV